MLGTALKLDGRLTIQTKGDGPLDLVTADYYGADENRDRGVRGYARLDADRFADSGRHRLWHAGGQGRAGHHHRAASAAARPIRALSSLSPDGIGASAETYFAQSEQLPTVIRLAAAPLYVAGDKQPHWRAGGIDAADDAGSREASARRPASDDWERLSLLLKTVEDLELVDTSLAPETLLWRLFHEDEVRVQPPEPVTFRCDCDTGAHHQRAEKLHGGGTPRPGRSGRRHPGAVRVLWQDRTRSGRRAWFNSCCYPRLSAARQRSILHLRPNRRRFGAISRHPRYA